MAKSYSRASTDVERTIERMREQFHPHLRKEGELNVTVGALFVFDLESTEPVLKHQGYAAAAVIKITSLKERVLGLADATMVIDRATWLLMSPGQRDALIDHELYHLDLVLDAETGNPTFDAHGRPRMEMRLHDRQFGWFDVIARRHGENSCEIRQAKYLLAETQQLYFDFKPPAANGGIQVGLDGTVSGGYTTADGTKVEVSGRLAFADLIDNATAFVRHGKLICVETLQEQFNIGHTSATALMTELEKRGVVGPVQANGMREVLEPAQAAA